MAVSSPSAETQAKEWLDRLELLAAGLAGADSLPDVVRLVVAQGLSGVQARGATLAIAEGDELQVMEATGFPQAAVARFLRFPLTAEVPLAQAGRSREPVWISSAEERIGRFPLLKDVDSGIRSTASLPLTVGGLLVGVLGVAFANDRTLSIPERRFLLATADLAALAVHRLNTPPAKQEWGDPPSMDILDRADRLAELERLDLLRQAPRQPLDRLSRLAARVVGAGMAQVSVLGTDQMIAGAYGFTADAGRTPLNESLCTFALALGSPLQIDDARSHPWVRELPSVRSGQVVRYLGVPLLTEGGHAVGALCVFDSSHQGWPAGAQRSMSELAQCVLTEIESAVTQLELSRALRRAERLYQVARDFGAATSEQEIADLVDALDGEDANSEWPSLLPEAEQMRTQAVSRIEAQAATTRFRVAAVLAAVPILSLRTGALTDEARPELLRHLAGADDELAAIVAELRHKRNQIEELLADAEVDHSELAQIAPFVEAVEILIRDASAYEKLNRTKQQLETALTSRAVIDQAKGMVMIALNCSADEAFEHLVRLSSTANEKVRQVAERIVADAVENRRQT
jgi:hypothetical protein